jgi:hypothetical protein
MTHIEQMLLPGALIACIFASYFVIAYPIQLWDCLMFRDKSFPRIASILLWLYMGLALWGWTILINRIL